MTLLAITFGIRLNANVTAFLVTKLNILVCKSAITIQIQTRFFLHTHKNANHKPIKLWHFTNLKKILCRCGK